MPVYNDPTPSIVGRELLGPQMGRKVTQGLPDFDPVAFLDNAKSKAEAPSADVVSDESSLPEDEEPAPLLEVSPMSAAEHLRSKLPGSSLSLTCQSHGVAASKSTPALICIGTRMTGSALT